MQAPVFLLKTRKSPMCGTAEKQGDMQSDGL